MHKEGSVATVTRLHASLLSPVARPITAGTSGWRPFDMYLEKVVALELLVSPLEQKLHRLGELWALQGGVQGDCIQGPSVQSPSCCVIPATIG